MTEAEATRLLVWLTLPSLFLATWALAGTQIALDQALAQSRTRL